jgi:hypothetical protein
MVGSELHTNPLFLLGMVIPARDTEKGVRWMSAFSTVRMASSDCRLWLASGSAMVIYTPVD